MLNNIMQSPVEQIAGIIEQIGAEMRKPSTIPDWMVHETGARLAGERPGLFRMGTPEWRAWRAHDAQLLKERIARLTREQEDQRRHYDTFVGPPWTYRMDLCGTSVVADKMRYGGDY